MLRFCLLLIWFVVPALFPIQAKAYDFSNFSYESDSFRVGSCTFNANYDYFYDAGMYGSGQVELQSNLPGVGYRYVGPKFNFFYDDYMCFSHGFACGDWEIYNGPQLTESNIEGSCGVTIVDGTFEAVNSCSGASQTYSLTTTQSISFDTATHSYFLGISSAGITKTVQLIDSIAPTVTLTSDASSPQSGLFTVTATFSEAVTGFAIGDVIFGNGTASNFNESAAPVYTFDVTPASDGTVTVDIAAGVAADGAGNNNTAATQLSVTVDGSVPTVTLTSDASAAQSGPFTVTATFSEPVTGFTLEDITVVNGSIQKTRVK